MSITEDEYKTWLGAMEPFLTTGSSLYYAIKMAGLLSHQTTIYDKVRLGDWFSQKIDLFQNMPGDEVNSSFHRLIALINGKIQKGEFVTRDELDALKFYALHHRSGQRFFVSRQETAPGKSLDEIVAELDQPIHNVDDVAENLSKQVLETQPPLQDQGQAGANSPVPPQPDSGTP